MVIGLGWQASRPPLPTPHTGNQHPPSVPLDTAELLQVVDTINAEAPAKKSFKFTIALGCIITSFQLTQEQTLRFSFPPSAFTGFITITIVNGCKGERVLTIRDTGSGYNAGLPNPALFELNSPRIRLVVNSVIVEGAFQRRILRAATADSASFVDCVLRQCYAREGNGGCVYLPAGTRLALTRSSLITGQAARGALIAMATGSRPQKGTYLLATGPADLYNGLADTPQPGGSIYIFKETPSKLKIKLSGIRDTPGPPTPAGPTDPAACSFLVTERADNSTAAEEGGAITLQLLKMTIASE